MREIKFRAKATDRDPEAEYRTNYKNGDWVFGLLTKPSITLSHGTLPAEMTNTQGISGITVDDNTLGQYTGLKDTIKNEIYEGDILEGTLTSAWWKGIIRCEVRWVRDGWVSVEHNPAGERIHKLLFAKDCKVIGNRFDNPKLMEE